MTPIAKDSENAATSASPVAPANSSPKSAAEAPARPQPVALEVPVTVNGARTVDGSDKREPFSEKSATVLVFGHGAVIRVSTLLAPGQLVFLTNEKTKKEVVCQVVKSKTDGNAVGYVELRFTEPAPGFWGMRFPSDTVVPQPAAQTRPAAPAPIPAAPKAVPPMPVAVQPSPVKPAITPVPVSPVVAAPEVSSIPTPVTNNAPSAAEPKFAFPTPVPPAPFSAPQTVSHPELAAPPAPVAAAPATPVVEARPAASITSTPVSKASDPSTEELKQQAARLQEQLSSLLFTEAPKPAAPASPDVAQKILEMADPSPASQPAAIKPIKVTAPPSPKPTGGSLETEEIKIPSWLAPLARETETPSSSANAFQVEGTNSDVESVIPRAPEQTIFSEAQESVRRPETAVFGGQLLGESQPAETATGKSKTGLFIGIAASLVLVAGGVWYSRQPGNAISGLLSGGSTPAAKSASAPESAAMPSPAEPVATPPAATPAPPRVNPPVEAARVASAPMDRNAHSTNLSPSAQRDPQPVVEEPKKPSFGDVHLATPAVTSHGNSSATPNDPALEINAFGNASAPISTLSDSHRAGPTAPVPIGGDVKPAKLIKSVPPIYPEMARSQRVSGDVQVDALIDANGNVGTMKVLSGSPLLHQAALNALKQWKYQPAELDGKPTSMHLTVTIQFRTQ